MAASWALRIRGKKAGTAASCASGPPRVPCCQKEKALGPREAPVGVLGQLSGQKEHHTGSEQPAGGSCRLEELPLCTASGPGESVSQDLTANSTVGLAAWPTLEAEGTEQVSGLYPHASG